MTSQIHVVPKSGLLLPQKYLKIMSVYHCVDCELKHLSIKGLVSAVQKVSCHSSNRVFDLQEMNTGLIFN